LEEVSTGSGSDLVNDGRHESLAYCMLITGRYRSLY
jgi:hypothetical protein